jgi:hypothetical protein
VLFIHIQEDFYWLFITLFVRWWKESNVHQFVYQIFLIHYKLHYLINWIFVNKFLIQWHVSSSTAVRSIFGYLPQQYTPISSPHALFNILFHRNSHNLRFMPLIKHKNFVYIEPLEIMVYHQSSNISCNRRPKQFSNLDI